MTVDVPADVVVVGAGPTGLMLACELRLAGVRPVVLERRAEPGQIPKANGLGGRIVEMLDYRGLLDRFRAEASFVGPFPGFPFGSVPLNFATLDSSPLLGIAIQQPRMEKLLGDRARELGVEIRRGHELLDFSQDDGGVTLDVRGPDGDRQLSTRHLVGCDGGRSLVRDRAGIGFPGTTDSEVLRLGHFTAPEAGGMFDDPEVEVPGFGRLQPGWNRTPLGRFIVTTLQPGVHVVGVRENDQAEASLATPMTLQEFQASVRRVLGTDLPLGEPIWLSRTVSQARLAQTYRAGRVLLAGDAAHLFPAGGSSLNVGLLDTVNLGWKLAAEVQGRAPSGLLDTYHAERHPVAARALMQTRAQAALDRAPGEDGVALRALLTELVQFEQPLRHLGEILHGSDIRYPMPGGGSHPLVGCFVPDLALTTADGPTRVAELLRTGKPVLLDLSDRHDHHHAAHGWTNHITIVTAHNDQAPADALLIRPDGHVAWADQTSAPQGATGSNLHDALSHWFGPCQPR
ncbi:FAD-dependent oxidoreductase [Actinosynnema sp. ALI-1.44]|uniref:FAD-dependent monooxygenase n=1 Tax=Actinosynnema sp. ALI-1.44 TaxID=1933779 RepID=UPI00097CB70D|nr:FAD-dependent monooxygenase [Actinosynnema sp. ALI-1.44]ONI86908.1 FAD-dependent oxidoreductase [Actinosynnema sp. ALI-1.44]